MDMGVIIGFAILAIVIIQFIAMIVLFSKNKQGSQTDISQRLMEYAQRLDKNEEAIRNEFGKNREETNKSARESREELFSNLKSMRDFMDSGLKSNREELAASLEKTRDVVEKKLKDIQDGNEKKLDQMRQTVDENLHKTLETRLGESFKLVSGHLEAVQKGIGEMQTLAKDVGGLKNILANVKNRGTLGEVQLESILEQILTPDQYERQAIIKSVIDGEEGPVDFAVKIPSKVGSNDVLLPIDAKFPTANYQILLDAYEKGEAKAIEKAQDKLGSKISELAKSIRDKYIAPPKTTDFGIMFLPFEGLYAEVLRIPGKFEEIQNTYKITIAGPTTISAFLNSLRMGFRTLAVEKRTSDIWDLLSAVKAEFGVFGDMLEKTKTHLKNASKAIDDANEHTEEIKKKLTDVQTLPQAAVQKQLSTQT